MSFLLDTDICSAYARTMIMCRRNRIVVDSKVRAGKPVIRALV